MMDPISRKNKPEINIYAGEMTLALGSIVNAP